MIGVCAFDDKAESNTATAEKKRIVLYFIYPFEVVDARNE
jgi:hypothetical protein